MDKATAERLIGRLISAYARLLDTETQEINDGSRACNFGEARQKVMSALTHPPVESKPQGDARECWVSYFHGQQKLLLDGPNQNPAEGWEVVHMRETQPPTMEGEARVPPEAPESKPAEPLQGYTKDKRDKISEIIHDYLDLRLATPMMDAIDEVMGAPQVEP